MRTCNRHSILSPFSAVMSALVFLLLFTVNIAHSRNLDVPFVPTPHNIVAAMLDAADVGPGDYVIDLGSGDGRIVIAAVERGAFGHGIDLNPVRVAEAETSAEEAGVSDRTVFLEGDLFEADISMATVVTMYLLNSVNVRLKPILFEQLRPGTRIVSYSFNMGQWEPDEHIVFDHRHVYYWVIPAKLSGSWEWAGNGDSWVMDVGQAFQKIDIELSAGNRTLEVQDPVITGERVSFLAVDRDNGDRYAFSGRVDGDTITGTIQVSGGETRKIENWNATLR